MKDYILGGLIGAGLFACAISTVDLSKAENGESLEIKQLRNEVQEYNARFEKLIECFRDMSTENDCSVKFHFKELEK